MTSTTTAAEPETIPDRFFIAAFATLALGMVLSLGTFGVVAYHGSLAQTGTVVSTSP